MTPIGINSEHANYASTLKIKLQNSVHSRLTYKIRAQKKLTSRNRTSIKIINSSNGTMWTKLSATSSSDTAKCSYKPSSRSLNSNPTAWAGRCSDWEITALIQKDSIYTTDSSKLQKTKMFPFWAINLIAIWKIWNSKK